MRVTISHEAADPKAGMTLDELRAFVHEAEACDLDGDTPVHVTTGWTSQIRKLQVPR